MSTASADRSSLGHDLHELIDRQEIADLISRLGLWLDDKRFYDAPSIFTDDVTVATPGGSARGLERAVDQARRNHDVDRTHHVITNVLIELDGDRATAHANLIATFVERADEPSSRATIGASYRFEAVRTPPGWRLSRVSVSPVWNG